MIYSQPHWFAAITRAKQEKVIKGRLDGMGVENYLPLRSEMRLWGGRRTKVQVSVIPNLVFVRTDVAHSFALINDYGLRMRYMRSLDGPGSLVVPDKQMQDFIFLMQFGEEQVAVCNADLWARGDRVRVVSGPFAGIEGELVRTGAKKRVVVRLEGIASLVPTEIPMSCLEKIV